MSSHFELPLGLRRWEQLPGESAALQREGYDLSPLEDCGNAYRFTAVVSWPKISQLVRTFSRYLPGEAFFILEYYPEEPLTQRPASVEERPIPEVFYSSYMPTAELIGLIKPYLERLVHDGFVGFGLANNRQGLEMFFSEEKVLTFFTDNHLRLCNFFQRQGLPFRPDLVLPADFGHDHISLLGMPPQQLPESLARLSVDDLDSVNFCQQLIDLLDMYPVEEGLSFFLTRKEQQEVARLLGQESKSGAMGDVEFGSLLLNWSDFVAECEEGFDGDLEEYCLGLKIRDLIQFVIDGVSDGLVERINQILEGPDAIFRRILIDRRKRIDSPEANATQLEPFWYQGVVRSQGVELRRDLIRSGWFAR
ncbi:MAG: hypothetical protein L3J63_07240 [Geopsychrobacter sp.]|nr:hypothetical protein [Geopsychrobacter sp.]